MSEPVNDGGPAFLHDRGGPYKSEWSGISVRDYFAAQAMAAVLGASGDVTSRRYLDKLADPRAEIAKTAYLMADAMLKARQS